MLYSERDLGEERVVYAVVIWSIVYVGWDLLVVAVDDDDDDVGW